MGLVNTSAAPYRRLVLAANLQQGIKHLVLAKHVAMPQGVHVQPFEALVLQGVFQLVRRIVLPGVDRIEADEPVGVRFHCLLNGLIVYAFRKAADDRHVHAAIIHLLQKAFRCDGRPEFMPADYVGNIDDHTVYAPFLNDPLPK